MKVGVLTLAIVGLGAAAAAAPHGRSRALVGAGGAIVASTDGGDRWQVVHVCPAQPGRAPVAGAWELLAADESVAGTVPCPADPIASFRGPVLRLTCDGEELLEWRPGQSRAVPVGEVRCLERSDAAAAAPGLPGPRPVLVPRRALRRRLVPALALGLERRTHLDLSSGHLTGRDRRTGTTVWIRLIWRLDELTSPAPTTSRSNP